MKLSLPAALTRGFVIAAMLLAVAASPASAAKTLAWKFKQGDKFGYGLRQKNDININAGGVELEILTLQTMDLSWTVKSVEADGTAEITQTVDRMQMKLSTPFTGEFEYDSKSEKKPEGQVWQMLGSFMEGMLGQEFTLKVKPTGEVVEIKLPEKLLEAIKAQEGAGGGRGGAGMMMGGGFGEEQIKEMIARAVINLPTEPVGDDGWKQEVKSKMGPLGTQITTLTYKLGGTCDVDGKSVDKIDVETELLLEPAEESDADIEMELTEQEGTGEVLFDAEAGRTVKATSKQEMTMEGDFMGNEFIQDRVTTTEMALGTSENLSPLPVEEPAAAEAGKGDDAKASADDDDDDDKEDKDEEGDKDDKDDDEKDDDKDDK